MTAFDLRTRIATITDAPDLARLNALFNGVIEDPSALAARLALPDRVETPILAFVDGRAVGFGAVRIVPPVFYSTPQAEITELFVEEAYRGKGVGRALMTHAEQLARERGAKHLLILVDAENDVAQKLYRGMGYQDWDLALLKFL